jgi:hypothetical protein
MTMNRTDKMLQFIAGLAAIAITAGILAVAGHMKAGLQPLDDIRTPVAARSADRQAIEVAIVPATIEVIAVRVSRTASNPVRKDAV